MLTLSKKVLLLVAAVIPPVLIVRFVLESPRTTGLPPLSLDEPLFSNTSTSSPDTTPSESAIPTPIPLTKVPSSSISAPLVNQRQERGEEMKASLSSVRTNNVRPSGKVVGLPPVAAYPTTPPRPRVTRNNPAVDALREAIGDDPTAPPNRTGELEAVGIAREAPVVTPTPVEEVDSKKEDNDLSVKVGGQARGFTLLPLLNPRARASIDAQVETLRRANLDEMYLGVLTDETFAQKFDNTYFASILKKLSAPDRSVILELYLTNGPTMREWNKTPINASFNKMDPADFREQIQSDDWVRRKYALLVGRVKEIVSLHRSLSPRNKILVSVMLEDNLDDASYRAARKITVEELGGGIQFIRNPCSCGYPGTNDDPLGDRLELHELSHLSRLRAGDGYTLDGVGYSYGSTDELSKLTVEGVRNALERSRGQGLSFFSLWRASRQGLYRPGVREHPSKRNFEVPSEEEMKIDISLLRHGLDPRP